MADETSRPLLAASLLGLSLAACPAPTPQNARPTGAPQEGPSTRVCRDVVTLPVFSLRVTSDTVSLDPLDGLPFRRHRAADLLVASGLLDEPTPTDPRGQGPNVHVTAARVLNLPAALVDDPNPGVEVDSLSAGLLL